jgi:hypothetical protein
MTKRSAKWISPLHIPKGRIGKAEIQHLIHEPGTEVMLANIRTLMFGGYRKRPPSQHVTYPYKTVWHQLRHDDHGVWTTDLPCEQFQQLDACTGFKGEVLLGGLGIGLIATLLEKNPKVERITIVEKDDDVIRLVEPHLYLSRTRIVHDDLFEFLKRPGFKFDYCFMDIWQSDGEWVLTHTVYPLRRLARNVVRGGDGHIRCWNECIMTNQVYHHLTTRIGYLGQKDKIGPDHPLYLISRWPTKAEETCNHYWPFYRHVNLHPEFLRNKELLGYLASTYCNEFGHAGWERRFKVSGPEEVQGYEVKKEKTA